MILVTGGTGFLGRYLLRELAAQGKTVRALYHSQLPQANNLPVEWLPGDVLDPESLQTAFAGCSQVYHCAAVVGFLPGQRKKILEVNVEGTANVVNASLEAGVAKLVHVSSVAAIGRCRGDEQVSEETAWEEEDVSSNYALSKYLAEREVWRGAAEGLQTVMVNPSLILGAGNWDSGPPQFFQRVWNGLAICTYGGSGIVSARDVVRLMILLMEGNVSGERFILNAEHWSFRDLFFTIADLLGKRRPFLIAKPWMMECIWREEMLRYRLTGMQPLVTKETARIASRWSRFDNSKVVAATGYRFESIRESLKEIAEAFLHQVESGKIK